MRVKLTKELGVFAMALALGSWIVLAGEGRGLTVMVPPVPAAEDAVPVSGREVPVQLPPLSREAPTGGGRDPFRRAGVWEPALPAPLGLPPAWPAGQLVPILAIAGGRSLAPAAPRLVLSSGLAADTAGPGEGETSSLGRGEREPGADSPDGADASETGNAEGEVPATGSRRRRGKRPPSGAATSTPLEKTGTTTLDLALLDDPAAPGFRRYDLLYLRDRPDEPVKGILVDETADSYVFRRRGRQAAIPYDRALVARCDRADRPEEYVARQSARLRPDDQTGHLRLARFASRYQRWALARTEGLLAAKARPSDPEGYRLAARAARARYAQVAPAFHPDLREKELEVYEAAHAAGAESIDLQLLEARALQEDGATEAAATALRGALAALREEAGLENEGAGAGASSGGAVSSASGSPTASTAPTALTAPSALSAPRATTTPSTTTTTTKIDVETATGTSGSLDPAVASAERWLEVGDLALGLGLLSDAAKAYEQASGPPSFAARAFTGLALVRFAQGRVSLAKIALDRAEAAGPEQAEPALLLGEISLFSGDATSAQSWFAQALQRGDQGPEREMYAALALSLLGQTAKAKTRIEALLKSDPTPWAQLVHAFCLEQVQDVAGARAIYEEIARAEGPARGIAAAALGALHASAGDDEAAFAAYTEAADAGYAPAELALALSRLSVSTGDLARGLRLARLAVSLSADETQASSETIFGEALYQRGILELQAGHPRLAQNALAGAARVALYPSLVACAEGRLFYGQGRYEEAAARFATVKETGEAGAYAKEALRRIAAAAGRLVWRDGFDRADGSLVRNRWQESERFGVEISLQKGAVRFRGVPARNSFGQTALVREVEKAKFSGLRARLRVPAGSSARFGISVRLGSREVRLYRDGDGTLRSTWKGSGKAAPKPVEIGRFEGTEHELSISVAGSNRSELVFRVDGREVGRARSRSLADRGTFAAAIFCEAPLGEAVDLACDEASLFQTRE